MAVGVESGQTGLELFLDDDLVFAEAEGEEGEHLFDLTVELHRHRLLGVLP